MFLMLIYKIPYLFFYIYAIRQCLEKRDTQEQPAKLACIAFFILLGKLIISAIVNVLFFITLKDNQPSNLFVITSRILSFVYIAAILVLLVAIFAWRDKEQDDYKEPGILAAIAIFMCLMIPFLSYLQQRYIPIHQGENLLIVQIVFGLLYTIFDISALYLLLVAVFKGRNASSSVAFSQPKQEVSATSTVQTIQTSPTTTTQPVKGGMFEEADFIPFIAGVVVFAGFILVPLIWGQMSNIDYVESIFPSLLSCGIFCASHDKRGNFLFGRFIIMMVFIFFTIIRTSLLYGGGKPMFMAGGLLGYFVMLGCGWMGIVIGRFIRRRI